MDHGHDQISPNPKRYHKVTLARATPRVVKNSKDPLLDISDKQTKKKKKEKEGNGLSEYGLASSYKPTLVYQQLSRQ